MPVHWTGQVGTEIYATPLWSIAIEEQYYWLWPLVVYFASRRTLVWGMAATILVGLMFSIYYFVTGDHWGHAYMSTLVRMGAICIGGLIAVTFRKSIVWGKLVTITRAVAYAVAVLLLTFGLAVLPKYPTDWFFGTIGYVLIPLFWGAMLLLVLQNAHGDWVGKPLGYLGQRSYAIYLFHFPLLVFWRMKLLPRWSVAGADATWIDMVGSLVCVGLTFLVAELAWRWVEQPMLKWKS